MRFKMNWFRRLFRTGNDGRKTMDERRIRPSSLVPRPSSLVHRPSSLNYALFLSLALLAGIFLIKTGILQSAPVTSTQTNWAGGLDGGAAGTLTGWTKYSAKDTGVAAGTDIQLQSSDYTAAQTSDTGAQATNDTTYGDTCSSVSCSIGGGFNAGALASTAVHGSGSSSRVTLGDGYIYPSGVTVEEWLIQQNAVNATTCNTTNRICNSLASWEDAADGA